MAYGMNIWEGDTGRFVGYMEHVDLGSCETLIKIELDLGNSVELFNLETNKPVSDYKYGKIIETDHDGFCYLTK